VGNTDTQICGGCKRDVNSVADNSSTKPKTHLSQKARQMGHPESQNQIEPVCSRFSPKAFSEVVSIGIALQSSVPN